MTNIKNNDAKSIKEKNPIDEVPTVIDFGERTITDQNFSRVCVLPKTALANCGMEENMKVNVQLVQDKKGRYIKLSPVCRTKEKTEESKEKVKTDE